MERPDVLTTFTGETQLDHDRLDGYCADPPYSQDHALAFGLAVILALLIGMAVGWACASAKYQKWSP